ncbi:hypothetical protein JAAARDRAFT_48729 [Jaapia argillacea MUCL 33604]|uniref:Uncharacterized protein n=1 Tax=Jaapia argillacea MUCL 33604 TaxID=933084 RepID=A0A067PKH9_9AGAM|nr:hypothetical protein JAAARDRAFT_48729 [Jaapia argillacea MUCL 33604]
MKFSRIPDELCSVVCLGGDKLLASNHSVDVFAWDGYLPSDVTATDARSLHETKACGSSNLSVFSKAEFAHLQFTSPAEKSLTLAKVSEDMFTDLGTGAVHWLRKVCARADLRFGEDDHTQWLQPFSEIYCHHITIPRHLQDPTDPLSIMWWTPDESSFVPIQDGSLCGLGKLSKEKLEHFRSLMVECVSRWEAFQQKWTSCASFAILCVAMKHSFVRLQNLATSRRGLMMAVTEFQHYYLEIVGGLDYMEIYRPVMDGLAPPTPTLASVIGAFTFEPSVAQWCFAAGIPIWLIRPRSSLLPSTVLCTRVELTPPNDLLEWQDWSLEPLPIIFTGYAGSDYKIGQIHKFSRVLPFPNPFSLPADITQHQSTSSQIASSSNRLPGSQIRGVFKTHDPQRGRSKFQDPLGPWVPPAIHVWLDALQAIDLDLLWLITLSRRSPQDGRFIFPDPGLFCLDNKVKALSYITAWLSTCNSWIFRVLQSHSGSLLSSQDWHYVFNALTDASQASTSISRTNTAQVKSRLLTLHFEGFVDVNDCQAHVGSQDIINCDDLILQCFKGDPDLVASYVVGEIPQHNVGLAADSWADRVPYLCALQDVMKSWQGDKPTDMTISLDPQGPNNESCVLALEQALARFYTQSFFNFFGRAASTPHKLPEV